MSVAVIDQTDAERQDIFQLLKGVKDSEPRVVGVINKVWPAGARCWGLGTSIHLNNLQLLIRDDQIVNLLKNDRNGASPIKQYLREGWFGLRNRAPAERDVSNHERDENERLLFKQEQWRGIDPRKFGRKNLREALIRVRHRHIRASIPVLVAEIETQLEDCTARIKSLGQERQTHQAQFMFLSQVASDYAQKVRSGLDGNYRDVTDTALFIRPRIVTAIKDFKHALIDKRPSQPLCYAIADLREVKALHPDLWVDKLLALPTYAWIRKEVLTYQISPNARRINPQVEATLWQALVVDWRKIFETTFDHIRQTVSELSHGILRLACPDETTRQKIINWLQEDYATVYTQAWIDFENIWRDECKSQVVSFSERREILGQNYRNKRLEVLASVLTPPNPTSSSTTNISKSRDEVEYLLSRSDELSSVLDLHDSLRAHHDITLDRIVDNFAIQVIERHFLGPRGLLNMFCNDYVTKKLYGPENEAALKMLAGEDEYVARERQDLQTKQKSLEESKKKVQAFLFT